MAHENSVISCIIYLSHPMTWSPPGSPSKVLTVTLSHSHSLLFQSAGAIVLPSDTELTIFHSLILMPTPHIIALRFPSFLQAAEDYASWEVLIC